MFSETFALQQRMEYWLTVQSDCAGYKHAIKCGKFNMIKSILKERTRFSFCSFSSLGVKLWVTFLKTFLKWT